MRHGDHKGNVLTSEAVAMCRATGKALKDSGIKIDEVLSSPAGRAVETGLETLHGYGAMVYFYTDARLGDMAVNTEGTAALKEVKTRAAARQLPGEEGLAVVMYDSAENFTELTKRRGEEGADCLCGIALKNPGKTFLVPTHGVARMENTIQALRGEDLHQPERLVDRCQIVELILNAGTGELVEENWLEPVSVPAT